MLVTLVKDLIERIGVDEVNKGDECIGNVIESVSVGTIVLLDILTQHKIYASLSLSTFSNLTRVIVSSLALYQY